MGYSISKNPYNFIGVILYDFKKNIPCCFLDLVGFGSPNPQRTPVPGALMVHHDGRFEGTESPPATDRFGNKPFVFVIPRQSKKVLR